MLCLTVGKNREKGKIEPVVVVSQESEDSKSPLEEKLVVMAGVIWKFGLFEDIFTFVDLIIRFNVSFHFSKIEYNKYLITQAKYNVNIASGTNTNNLPKLQEVENPSNTDGNKILKIIMLFIAIIVVAIPEGLLLTVTLSLAFAITKMQADNNLVRFMTSCETMGYANN